MLPSKKHITFLLCFLLCACKGQQHVFVASRDINAGFFEQIPPIIANFESITPSPFTQAIVYKTTFRQKYAESENVLVEALLHDSSVTRPVSYMQQIPGFRQDLYLVRLKGNGHKDYFAYFSIWYNDANAQPQIGFGPAYLLKKVDSLTTMTSMRGLAITYAENRFYLKPLKKSREFFFVLDSLPENQIGIQRIVLTEKNKIGGNKKLVYIVPGTKLDRLIFTRTATISLQ